MNDRIKELALKSGIAYLSEHTAYLTANDGLTVLPSVSSLEKFAELIVRECMSLVAEPGSDMNDTERGILAQIKQHFGVEE